VRWRATARAAAGAERESDPGHTGLSLPNKGSKFSREPLWALPGLRSLAGVGGQPCAATTPAGGFVCRLAAAASVPRRPTQEKSSKAGQQHQRHRQQRSPPQKEGRETLRLVVASATEPGTWLFPTVRAAAKRCGRICGMAAAGPTPSGSQHTEPAATAATGPSKPCCGSCYSEAGVDALAQTRRVHFVTLITRRKQ
jgi:hypothetical protein